MEGRLPRVLCSMDLFSLISFVSLRADPFGSGRESMMRKNEVCEVALSA